MNQTLYLLLSLGLLVSGKAQTLFRGSHAFDVRFQSDGTLDLAAADFTFGIGTFDWSADPTLSDANRLAVVRRVAGESGTVGNLSRLPG